MCAFEQSGQVLLTASNGKPLPPSRVPLGGLLEAAQQAQGQARRPNALPSETVQFDRVVFHRQPQGQEHLPERLRRRII